MSIDRIGKPPLPAVPPATSSTVVRTGGSFDVTAKSSTEPVQNATAVDRSAPLEQLRAGMLDRGGYLDAKIKSATAHLHGLPEQHLEFIHSHLRMLLAADPTLTSLVERATGSVKPGQPLP